MECFFGHFHHVVNGGWHRAILHRNIAVSANQPTIVLQVQLIRKIEHFGDAMKCWSVEAVGNVQNRFQRLVAIEVLYMDWHF